jgi:hypothetical protein
MRDWGNVILDVIHICFCFVLRRNANAKLQPYVHYSTVDDKNNIKSNPNPNDINEDVYNHLGENKNKYVLHPVSRSPNLSCTFADIAILLYDTS